jgi:hypothetical protein
MVTIFCLALFDHFRFMFLYLNKEDRVKLAHFFQLIVKNMGPVIRFITTFRN